jgi:hypothetical protein
MTDETIYDEAREFSRRRNLVGTTIRYLPAGRTMTVVLSRGGTELGSKTDLTKRGKVVSTLYVLPRLTSGD